MKRILFPGILAFFLLAFLILSVKKIPEGTLGFCSGKVLKPGWHLTLPFQSIQLVPGGGQTFQKTYELITREGAKVKLFFKLSYQWDEGKLEHYKTFPSLETFIEEALKPLSGRLTVSELLGQGKERVLQALNNLPITLRNFELSSPDLLWGFKPKKRKLLIIGMDGLDWLMLDRLSKKGLLPTFQRLIQGSAYGPLLSHRPLLSPLIWTSIATGRYPDDHGILDFVVKDEETGQDVPITSNFRKVHTFWSILTQVNVPVNIVGWWATFPAEKVSGVMVTERLFYQLFGMENTESEVGNTYPPQLEKELRALMIAPDDIPYEEISQFCHISRKQYEEAIKQAKTKEDPYGNRINHLRHLLATTRNVFAVAKYIYQHHLAQVNSFYLEGTDVVGHRFAHFLPPKLSWVSKEDFQAFYETMDRYYIYVDELLGDFLKVITPDTNIFLISDHGFYTGPARPQVPPDDFTVGAPQWHRLQGVFIAKGPDIQPGKLNGADVYDLVPTWFYLLGLPQSKEFVGKPLKGCLIKTLQKEPENWIASYEGLPKPWQWGEAPKTMDENRIKELQALGYLAGAPKASSKPPQQVQEAKFTKYYNEGGTAFQRKDYKKALELFQKALELKPDFALGHVALANVYRELRDHPKAYNHFLKAITLKRMIPPKVLIHLVEEGEALQNLPKTEKFLQAIKKLWQKESLYYSALGLCILKQGREGEAQKYFEKALSLNPTDPVAVENLIALYLHAGKLKALEAMLKRDLELSQTSIHKLNQLGIVCLRKHQPYLAELAFRKVALSDPNNGGILGNLAAALKMQGKDKEALHYFREAVRLRPEDPGLHYNLGATLVEMGKLEEALEAFQKTYTLGRKGPPIYAALAKVYVRMGRIQEADRILKEGLQAHPDNPMLKDLYQALKEGRG